MGPHENTSQGYLTIVAWKLFHDRVLKIPLQLLLKFGDKFEIPEVYLIYVYMVVVNFCLNVAFKLLL